MVSSPGHVPLVQNEEKSNYTDHRQGRTLHEKNITKTKTERNGKKVNKVKLQIICNKCIIKALCFERKFRGKISKDF